MDLCTDFITEIRQQVTKSVLSLEDWSLLVCVFWFPAHVVYLGMICMFLKGSLRRKCLSGSCQRAGKELVALGLDSTLTENRSVTDWLYEPHLNLTEVHFPYLKNGIRIYISYFLILMTDYK